MEKISDKQLMEMYLDTLEKCGAYLLKKSDEDIEYNLFEEFDIGATTFLHDTVLGKLKLAGYIDSNIIEKSKKLRNQYMIRNVGTAEFSKIKQGLKKDKKAYVVVIDGREIQSWQSYLDKMFSEFQMPLAEYKNSNAYLDWMMDLGWLNSERYVFAIENYHEFMKGDLSTKKAIVDDFREAILPFWEEEVKHVVVGGRPKEFQVYLID